MSLVAVGMSGGVDSSVAAAMLRDEGHEVVGVFIETYNAPGCKIDEDRRDALQVATKLGIKFVVLDLKTEYKRRVVKYFLDEYRAGRTPNPDIVCNREIKFGLFYDWARGEGYEYVATGHYARIANTGEGYRVREARDEHKDQSFFLWMVERDNLAKVLWPLGELTKREVRDKARSIGLHNANKPDSMGVCMLGEMDIGEYLRQELGERPGKVLWEGREVGSHKGLWFFTIGQRGGWEWRRGVQTEAMPSLYVIAKDKGHNTLTIGTHRQAWQRRVEVEDIRGEVAGLGEGRRWMRIRNLGEKVLVNKLERVGGERWSVLLEKPLYGIAASQSGVFYDEEGVVVAGALLC